ncbi:MAG TPA: hypothetical protein VGI05_26060 [Streptosporangiaceae bacterium]
MIGHVNGHNRTVDRGTRAVTKPSITKQDLAIAFSRPQTPDTILVSPAQIRNGPAGAGAVVISATAAA